MSLLIGAIVLGVTMLFSGTPTMSHFEQGLIAMQKGQLEVACQELEKSYSISPSDHTRFLMGVAYLKSNRVEEGVSVMTELANSPNRRTAVKAKAVLYDFGKNGCL